MTTRTLALIALLGAPFLCIGVYLDYNYTTFSRWSGIWSFFYITGWMASMEVLRRVNAAGTGRYGQSIIWLVLATLLIANLSNVWQIVTPTYKPTLFYVLDSCWPLSNMLMLAVGWVIAQANQLPNWQRWVPLLVGCWLPLCMILGRTPFAFHASNMYSAIAWTLLAFVAFCQTTRKKPVTGQKEQPTLAAGV